jgi:hypothetical protein
MGKISNTLEVARDMLKSCLKHEPTKGSVLTALQQVQQALLELEAQDKLYDLVRKVERL